MGKRVWMLCWGLMAMVMAMAVNVSAAEAANHHTMEVWPDSKKSSLGVDYLEGRQYRITAVYPEKDGSYKWVRPEEVGSVLEAMWVDINSVASLIEFVLVSAPANTRFAKNIEVSQNNKSLSGDVLLSRVETPMEGTNEGPWNHADLEYLYDLEEQQETGIFDIEGPQELTSINEVEELPELQEYTDINKLEEQKEYVDINEIKEQQKHTDENDSFSARTVIVSGVQPIRVTLVESGNTVTVYDQGVYTNQGLVENPRPIFVMERIR